jgi:hypothetical protein
MTPALSPSSALTGPYHDLERATQELRGLWLCCGQAFSYYVLELAQARSAADLCAANMSLATHCAELAQRTVHMLEIAGAAPLNLPAAPGQISPAKTRGVQ